MTDIDLDALMDRLTAVIDHPNYPSLDDWLALWPNWRTVQNVTVVGGYL